MFNAKGYVSSPRSAYGVRSALLFTLLQRLHDAGLEAVSYTHLDVYKRQVQIRCTCLASLLKTA